MVGNTFRIAAFGDTVYFFRHHELLLLHNLEVADHVDRSLRGYESQLVELLVLEELVRDLDDAFPALRLAGEVDSDCDLVPDAFEVEDIQGLIYIFSGYMVQYGTILQSAYYQFFPCHNSLSVISNEVEGSV